MGLLVTLLPLIVAIALIALIAHVGPRLGRRVARPSKLTAPAGQSGPLFPPT
jgi:hypothetical protein